MDKENYTSNNGKITTSWPMANHQKSTSPRYLCSDNGNKWKGNERYSINICHPPWEKVPLGGKYIMEIAKDAMVLENVVFVQVKAMALRLPFCVGGTFSHYNTIIQSTCFILNILTL